MKNIRAKTYKQISPHLQVIHPWRFKGGPHIHGEITLRRGRRFSYYETDIRPLGHAEKDVQGNRTPGVTDRTVLPEGHGHEMYNG